MFPWRQREQTELSPQRRTRPTPENATIYGAIIRATNSGRSRAGLDTLSAAGLPVADRVALIQGRRSGKWSFPKGHANTGESPFDCVVREVGEEIGFDALPAPCGAAALHVGYYYKFEVPFEFQLAPRDLDEVCAAGWFTVGEIRRLPVNVDVSWWLTH